MSDGNPENSKELSTIQKTALIVGPLISIFFIALIDLDPQRPEITHTAAVALLMAIWWITEALPLAVTSLLPMVLFPLLGIMDGRDVASEYFNYVIFLFVGGFMVALAMERWELHKRIALKILLWVGNRPRSILLGFMAATAFLSMWISNTATAMMMIPIAMAIIWKLEENLGREAVQRYSVGIFLGIAYSASIGGIATLVGTPPNPAFVQIFAINFPRAPEISFSAWFVFAMPVSLIFLFLVWGFLSYLYRPSGNHIFRMDVEIFQKQYRALGPMSYEEKVVLIDFILLAILWLFRADFQIGALRIPGWAGLFGQPEYINDGVVAIGMAVMLFLIPAKQARAARILDWSTASRLPWGIVLLFGGGFALASGFKDSGLSAWLGGQLQGLSGLHPLLIIVIICTMITFLTELTSNTASAQILLPLLASLAVAIKVNPLLLMIPGTLSCSFAFMLPVATPPNAIVFGTERLRVADMAKTGFLLNLLGVLLITLAAYFWANSVFQTDLMQFPAWAGER